MTFITLKSKALLVHIVANFKKLSDFSWYPNLVKTLSVELQKLVKLVIYGKLGRLLKSKASLLSKFPSVPS